MKAHTFEQKDSQEKKLDDTTGELTLTQIIISHGKEHYLLHPLFETFIKVNIPIDATHLTLMSIFQQLPILTLKCFFFLSAEVAQN